MTVGATQRLVLFDDIPPELVEVLVGVFVQGFSKCSITRVSVKMSCSRLRCSRISASAAFTSFVRSHAVGHPRAFGESADRLGGENKGRFSQVVRKFVVEQPVVRRVLLVKHRIHPFGFGHSIRCERLSRSMAIQKRMLVFAVSFVQITFVESDIDTDAVELLGDGDDIFLFCLGRSHRVHVRRGGRLENGLSCAKASFPRDGHGVFGPALRAWFSWRQRGRW